MQFCGDYHIVVIEIRSGVMTVALGQNENFPLNVLLDTLEHTKSLIVREM